MPPSPVTVAELAGRIAPGRVAALVGDRDVAVVDLTHDSREAAPGVLFACLVGEHHDGHDFAPDAVRAGCPALLVSRRLDLDVAQIVVDDTRAVVGPVAAAVHHDPSRAMRTVGITGTNGKTTTAQLVAAVLGHAGLRPGVLGTLTGARTTPEAADLQRRLAAFRDEGAGSVVMEVSSHALALSRVDGTHYDVAVFTNLGRDHLDLHGSMEEYFRAKARLFTPELSSVGVVNVDDRYGSLLWDARTIDMVRYGRDDVTDVVVDAARHAFTWRGRRVEVGLGGEFNVMNSLAALTASAALGVDPDEAVAGLRDAAQVPGRFEVVATPPDARFTVVVDYAHTPDGLTQLLAAARAVAAGGAVRLVFGCGGDRDRDKRPEMGAASLAADHVVVTSDNPRHEDPMAIIGAILTGVPPHYRDRVAIEPDRRAAIATALGEARPGDVVVIAGKGHETTQTIGATALPFDDRVVARELLEDLT